MIPRTRRRLAIWLLQIAERLDSRYAFRGMTSFSYTYEEHEGLRLREDGRGCPLWRVAGDGDRAWAEADTDWAARWPALDSAETSR